MYILGSRGAELGRWAAIVVSGFECQPEEFGLDSASSGAPSKAM